jgi:hypothetical protein
MVRVKQLVVFLLVVAALAVGADRAAAWEAGQVLSNKLASTYNLDQKPTIQVRGVPFLTQWGSGQYEEIDAQLPLATVDQVRITDISAQLHDIRTAAFVTSSADISGARVGIASVQGMVPYSNLPLPQGFQASAAGDRLHLTGSVRAGPLSIPMTATVRVGAQNGQLTLTAESVNTSNPIAQNTVAATVRQQLEATSLLRSLPFGVQLQAVTVTQSGLQIAAVGHNLQMPR